MRLGWSRVLGLGLLLSAMAAAAQDWQGPAQPVRLAPERDYGPFIYQAADGRVEGLSMDLLALLQARMGLQLQALPARSLNEQLRAAQAREADLLTSLRPTPGRGDYLLFTRPYVSVPAVLVAPPRRGTQGLSDLAGRRVAVGQGYAVEAWVRSRHPRVDWQAVSDDAAALRGVASGRYQAAVLDQASFGFHSRRLRLTGLQVVEDVGFEYPLSFAVRSDWPALHRALDEAIGGLPRSAREAVLLRWLEDGRGTLPGAGWRHVLILLGGAFVALGLLLLIALQRRHRARREGALA